VDLGKEIKTKWIEVNDPLTYKGVTFYQSSYGLMEEGTDIHYILRATSATGGSETFNLHMGEKFTIPGTKVEVKVEDFSPALRFDEAGRASTYSEMMNNPAVLLEIKNGKNTYPKWVMKRYPGTGRLEEGHAVELADIWGAQYTGLQVRRDPGVWVVYLGCIIMSIGLYIAFFTSHRKVWAVLRESKGVTKVTLAGAANKGRPALERKLDKIKSLLEGGGK